MGKSDFLPSSCQRRLPCDALAIVVVHLGSERGGLSAEVITNIIKFELEATAKKAGSAEGDSVEPQRDNLSESAAETL